MMNPTPAPRAGPTIPDISDQKNQPGQLSNEAVAPRDPTGSKIHKEARITPADPSTKVFDRETADPTTRTPTEELHDIEKAKHQEIPNPEARTSILKSAEISPASPYSGPTLHKISDEKPAE